MEILLSDKQMETIATKTARIVLRKLKEDEEPPSEMVSVHEAARILGISESHMRRIKDCFPHVKAGSHQQGRVLFERSALLQKYVDRV